MANLAVLFTMHCNFLMCLLPAPPQTGIKYLNLLHINPLAKIIQQLTGSSQHCRPTAFGSAVATPLYSKASHLVAYWPPGKASHWAEQTLK